MNTSLAPLLKSVRVIFYFALVLLTACSKDAPLSAMGLLEWDRIELVAEANEPILEIFVHEGQTLEPNTAILRQDARRLQAQLDEAEALLAQSQAKLAELKRGPREERIDEAKARLEGAQSQQANDRKEFIRAQSLQAEKLISPEAVDAAQTRLKKATADTNAARASLEELLHGTTAEELRQADAAVSQSEAHVRALSITLDNLTLRAPRKGLLDNLPYEAGERPPAGAVVAVMLADTTPYARIYVPEPLRAQVHQGSAADVFIDGIERPFSGRVRMISSEAVFTPFYSLTERDRSRLSYLAEVELTDRGTQTLPSGIPVRVEFRMALEP